MRTGVPSGKRLRRLGCRLKRVDLLSADGVEAAFEPPAMRRAQAFFSDANGFFFDAPHKLADVALRHRVPSITNNRRNFAEAGLLMTYGPNLLRLGMSMAAHVVANGRGRAAGSRDAGWLEGQNVVIDSRLYDDHPEHMPDMAAELLALKPDVLVGGLAPRAGLRAHQRLDPDRFHWYRRRLSALA